MAEEIKIGTTLWTLDSRDRRAGWKPCVVTGETSRSWIVGEKDWAKRKILKKTMLENLGQWGSERWFTAEGMEEQIWLNEHRNSIANLVSVCRDTAILKKIAELIGFESGRKVA